MRRNEGAKRTREQVLADLERERERHTARIAWAKGEILLSKARLDPWGFADNLYNSLEDVSDVEAEAWLAVYDKRNTAH